MSRSLSTVQAMILGADAVAVGRLFVYGLAAAGGPGIVRLLEILEHEITICLVLLGVTSFAALDKTYLSPARPVTTFPAGMITLQHTAVQIARLRARPSSA